MNEKLQLSETEKRSVETYHDLAEAFGGYSQVPDRVIGMALAGRINNGGLKFGNEELNAVVEAITDRWEEQDLDPVTIRENIIGGMEEMTKVWEKDPKNDAVVAVKKLRS